MARQIERRHARSRTGAQAIVHLAGNLQFNVQVTLLSDIQRHSDRPGDLSFALTERL